MARKSSGKRNPSSRNRWLTLRISQTSRNDPARASAVEIANRAVERLEMENRIRKEIRAGSTLAKVADLYKWEKRSGSS